MKKPNQLSRRDFLKLSGMTSVGLGLSACGLASNPTEVPIIPSLPTQTSAPSPISAIAPSPTANCADLTSLSKIPQISGERYLATIPDTLDLQERALLVINSITNCTDPKNNFAPYDNMNIWRNPPVMSNTTMFNGKYFEAMGLLRYMTGSTTNPQVDQSWRTLFMRSQADYPWWGVDGGRILAWMGNNFRFEKNPCWLELEKQVVKRLSDKMVYVDNYCYYPNDQGGMPTGWDATWGGWGLQGLAILYQATGNSAVLDLAGKLARFLKDHALVFDKNAHFLARHPSDNGLALHFHHNGNAMEGISAYALVANDHEFASFARSSYEWARSLGSPLIGFFPEYINDWPDDRPFVDCETCCTADMIEMAMNLTEARQGDYWDDVDRYVRNQFIEMQLTEKEWIDEMVANLPTTNPETWEDSDRVSERILGSFSSWAAANDWYIEGEPGTTFCCIGNGGRALFYVWEKMIGFKNGTLSIHLLLNRASTWADVNSYVPYEGQVDITMKVACNLQIRIPEWVKPDDVTGLVNGQMRELYFLGRYAQIGYVGSMDKVVICFPISERTVETTIGNEKYTLIIKGNDVVSIDPPGKCNPLYQREKYRENKVRWVKRERFIPA